MDLNALPELLDLPFDFETRPSDVIRFSNGVKVHCFSDTASDCLRLEFLFMNAGNIHQNKLLTALTSVTLITEGTRCLSALDVADRLDYYGVFVEKNVYREFSSVVFHCLKKYIGELLPLIEQIIKYPEYDKEELAVHIAKGRQKTELNDKKTSTIAMKAFYRSVFPDGHPFSSFAQKEDWDALTRQDLLSFSRQFYSTSQCEIILAGDCSDELIRSLELHFGESSWGETSSPLLRDYDAKVLLPVKTEFVNKQDASQSSIMVGKPCINHLHGDFFKLKVLVCLFGGYFGSRLMTNIREEKAYTYGISADIKTNRRFGVLSILADVKLDKAEETLKEIDFEIERLQNELADEEELRNVKNYLLGDCLRALDGVTEVADRFSYLKGTGCSLSYFQRLAQETKRVSAEELRLMARKYLDKDEMYRVIVGKFSQNN